MIKNLLNVFNQNGMNDKEIHTVAESGDLNKLKELVYLNPRMISSYGWLGKQPLHYAARSGNLECVQFLVRSGAKVNYQCSNQTTAIFEASTEEIVEFLHLRGSSINHVSKLGRVPLDYAIQNKYFPVVKYLIESGVDVNLKIEPDFFKTMLQWAISEIFSGHKEEEVSFAIVKILLEAGADPNQKNVFGSTGLHTAVENGLSEFVSLMLLHNADPCIRNESGISCFEIVDNDIILKMLEPYKVNLVIDEKIQDDFEGLIERIIATGEARETDFMPCEEKDIIKLQNSHDVIFPEEYKKFLRVMGKGAGDFLISDHWDIFLPSLNNCLGKWFFIYDDEDLAAGEIPLIQPEKFFVFASRLGDWPLGFFCDESTQDPVIYRLDDDSNLIKEYESFWGFIQKMLEYYEFYSDPQKFSQ